jgi:hypothetical protein
LAFTVILEYDAIRLNRAESPHSARYRLSGGVVDGGLMPDTYRWKAAYTLTPGGLHVRFGFAYDGGFGKGGVGTLSVDSPAVDTRRLEHTVPLTWPIFEGLDVGGDYSTPVDASYSSPNKFTLATA